LPEAYQFINDDVGKRKQKYPTSKNTQNNQISASQEHLKIRAGLQVEDK